MRALNLLRLKRCWQAASKLLEIEQLNDSLPTSGANLPIGKQESADR